MEIILAGLIGFVIGVLSAVAIQNISVKFSEVVRRNKEIQEQIEELQDVKNKTRQSGATMAGLEDAMSSLISLQYNRQIEGERLDAALRTLQQLRKGPYEYDPDQPNNRREFK